MDSQNTHADSEEDDSEYICSEEEEEETAVIKVNSARKKRLKKTNKFGIQDDNISDSVSFIKPNSKRKWRVNGAKMHNEILMKPYKTYEEAWEAYDQHTIANCVEFVSRNTTMLKTPHEGVTKKFERNACIFIDDYQLPKILPVMKFVNNGLIPFVPIGLLTLQCRHGPKDGKDRDKQPRRFRDRQNNCHAMVKILQVAFFPQHEILIDTDEYRKASVDQIRSAVHNGNAHYEVKYYLGISANHNHPIGEENAKYLRIDPRVREAAEKLVEEGVVYTRELSHFIKFFVEGLITAKVIPRPHPTNSRFYPDKNILNGICRKVLQKMQADGREVPTPSWKDKHSGLLEERRQRVFATTTNAAQLAEPAEQRCTPTQPTNPFVSESAKDDISTSSVKVGIKPPTQHFNITPEEIQKNKNMAKAIGCLSLADELQTMSVPVKYRTIVQMYLNRISKLSMKLSKSDDLLALGNSLKSLHDAVKHLLKSGGKNRTPDNQPFLIARSAKQQYHFTPVMKKSRSDRRLIWRLKANRNRTHQQKQGTVAKQSNTASRLNLKRQADVRHDVIEGVTLNKHQKMNGSEELRVSGAE